MNYPALFLVVVTAIVLNKIYIKHAKVWAIFIGVLAMMFGAITLGAILVMGAVLALVWALVKKCGQAGAKYVDSQFANQTQVNEEFENLIKAVDAVNPNVVDDITFAIHVLSEYDKKHLTTEQITLIRQKIAELWKKYYAALKQGTHSASGVKSPYDVLNVKQNATLAEIRKAYIKLCKKYHPDTNHSKDAEQKFKEIQEAYSILTS